MNSEAQNFYELLGVSNMANSREIGLAFRHAAKRWHPDLNAADAEEATERMKRVSAAYEVLRDPERRAAYDRSLQFDLDKQTSSSDVDECDPPSIEAWWTSAPGSPVATMVPDPGAPPGFWTAPPRLSLVRTLAGSKARPLARAACKRPEPGGHQPARVAVVWLAVRPFLLFLLAAWYGRRSELLGWGALYALGLLICAIGVATASPLLVLAGPGLLLLGAVHCLCWRHRLQAVFARDKRESRR
jgi:DnaJ domain